MNDRQAFSMDGLDTLLIKELEQDGRQTVAQLSKNLRMSWSTVSDRIKRLEEEGVIRFVTLIDPLAFGYPTQFLIAINAPPGQVDSVASNIANVREARHVSIHTGRYNILVWVALSQSRDIWEFMNSKLAPISGISSAELMINLKLFRISLSLLSNRSPLPLNAEPPERPVDELDRKLMRQLNAHPRSSYPEIAAIVGCSQATVQRRVQRLLNSQTLRIAAIADPIAFGYVVRATIGLKLRPDMVEGAATTLSQFSHVNYLLVTAGSFDIVFTTLFKTNDDLSEFVRDSLGSIPGIMSHEIMMMLKITKDDFGVDTGSRQKFSQRVF